MNKWILCICCFFPFWGWTNDISEKNELKAIEEEIQELKKHLQQDRLNEIKEEVEGQGFMIADWDAYAKEIQLIRKQEEEANQIQLQIEKLEQRKAQLLQLQPQPQ